MHRIDTSTAQIDKFGVGKNVFTGGNPQTGELPTALNNDYFDAIQEELTAIIEETGVALDKNKHDQILTALKALLLQTENNLSEIKAAGSSAVAAARANLGLDTAALRDIGGAPDNVPDMSSFIGSITTPGYQRLPGGMIMQWGNAVIPTAGSVVVTYPLAMTMSNMQIVSPIDASSTNNYRVGIATSTLTTITLASTNTSSATGVMWFVIGKL